MNMFHLTFAETNNLEKINQRDLEIQTINHDKINHHKLTNKESKEEIKLSKSDYIILLFLTILNLIPFTMFFFILIFLHQDNYKKAAIMCGVIFLILFPLLPLIFSLCKKFPIGKAYLYIMYKMFLLFILIILLSQMTFWGCVGLTKIANIATGFNYTFFEK